LQEKDLALQIGEAGSLGSLDIFELFEGLEASQEFFGIRRASVE